MGKLNANSIDHFFPLMDNCTKAIKTDVLTLGISLSHRPCTYMVETHPDEQPDFRPVVLRSSKDLDRPRHSVKGWLLHSRIKSQKLVERRAPTLENGHKPRVQVRGFWGRRKAFQNTPSNSDSFYRGYKYTLFDEEAVFYFVEFERRHYTHEGSRYQSRDIWKKPCSWPKNLTPSGTNCSERITPHWYCFFTKRTTNAALTTAILFMPSSSTSTPFGVGIRPWRVDRTSHICSWVSNHTLEHRAHWPPHTSSTEVQWCAGMASYGACVIRVAAFTKQTITWSTEFFAEHNTMIIKRNLYFEIHCNPHFLVTSSLDLWSLHTLQTEEQNTM
jgi:hypothetical protein